MIPSAQAQQGEDILYKNTETGMQNRVIEASHLRSRTAQSGSVYQSGYTKKKFSYELW